MTQQSIRRIAIVGAGTMGMGIGQEFAQAGAQVRLYRRSREKLAAMRESIAQNLQELVDWGLLSSGNILPVLDRIQISESLEEAVSDVDLVIEAVFEDLDLKQRIFRELDRICAPRTILASNTSSYMPGQLAKVTQRPDRVLGTHFFYPPHLVPLVEIVRGKLTSDETVNVVYETVKLAGKSPIVIQKETPGFIANRLQTALRREAMFIVARGIATAQDVDVAVKQGFGRRLASAGPIEMAEVQDGWDVIWEIDGNILPHLDASSTPSPAIHLKVQSGQLGPKTGKGFYEWRGDSLETWRKRLFDTLAGFLLRE
jgi:3-hydroxybutyryl-CoA dehydrogenase